MIEGLRVYHLKKAKAALVGPMPVFSDAFSLDTCQRRIVISYHDLPRLKMESFDCSVGQSAYEFLLRFASGLESEVIGEADVFGQLKDAWKQFSANSVHHSRAYSSLFHKVFEDTKEIRANYLQGTGSQSYGSLVRRFLAPSEVQSRLSLLGAGKIAQSILPWLTGYELSIWNRSTERLVEFESERSARGIAAAQVWVGESHEQAAWEASPQVVVCIPVDTAKDIERLRWAKEKTVIHLGGNRSETRAWKEALGDERFFCLEDLYEVLNRQGSARDEMVMRARRACQERAQLRALGGSLSLPHGWEDLALFA